MRDTWRRVAVPIDSVFVGDTSAHAHRSRPDPQGATLVPRTGVGPSLDHLPNER